MNLVNHSIGVRNFKYTLFVTFLLGMLTAFGPLCNRYVFVCSACHDGII